MDMAKAFDLVRHSIMFRKIITAGLSLIFVRLLILIYVNQFANVRWNGLFSEFFSMRNGVRQGAVLSAIFYCIYRVSQKNGPPTVGAFTTICKLPIVIKTNRAQFPVDELKNEW